MFESTCNNGYFEINLKKFRKSFILIFIPNIFQFCYCIQFFIIVLT